MTPAGLCAGRRRSCPGELRQAPADQPLGHVDAPGVVREEGRLARMGGEHASVEDRGAGVHPSERLLRELPTGSPLVEAQWAGLGGAQTASTERRLIAVRTARPFGRSRCGRSRDRKRRSFPRRSLPRSRRDRHLRNRVAQARRPQARGGAEVRPRRQLRETR